MTTFFVAKDGPSEYRVFATKGSGATMLEHDRLTSDEAGFLAAHVNHAFECGKRAGDKERAAAIRAALGLL